MDYLMNKFIEIYCPKEPYKNYFSKKNNGYTNSLNVYLNDKILFEKINDCEELLPIKLVSQQNINIKTKNELKFDYDKDGYTKEGISFNLGLDFFWFK
jgi:hypothetical protein